MPVCTPIFPFLSHLSILVMHQNQHAGIVVVFSPNLESPDNARIHSSLKGRWLPSFRDHRHLREALASHGFDTVIVPVYSQINKPTEKSRTLGHESHRGELCDQDLAFKEFQGPTENGG